VDNNGGWSFGLMLDMLWYHLRFLECEFESNSTPKASSRGEGCPSLIYSNLALFIADARLGFFPIHTKHMFGITLFNGNNSFFALQILFQGVGEKIKDDFFKIS